MRGMAVAACFGDLNGDNQVTVAEIITIVNAALAGCSEACAGDFNGDGMVSIDEIVTAINASLADCPPGPTPTPTVAPSARLEDLVGDLLTVTYLLGATHVTKTFGLRSDVMRVDGVDILNGIDIGASAFVVVRLISDFEQRPDSRRTFGLVRVGESICDLLVFDAFQIPFSNQGTIVGEYLPSLTADGDSCGPPLATYPVTGTSRF